MEGVKHSTKINMRNRIVLRVGDKFKSNIPKFLRDIEYLYCGKVQVGNKEIDKWVPSFMFENANIDTGLRRSSNRYPVFTTKEGCIEWLKS